MANGILNTQLENSDLGLKGLTPDKVAASEGSTLHNESSINNKPQIERRPSDLDLNGNTPSKYTDNLPQ